MNDSAFIYYDGDDIGLKFEQAYLDSDKEILIRLSMDLENIHNDIKILIESYGGQVIESGGDEGLLSIKISKVDVSPVVYAISVIWHRYGLRASVGSGSNIQDAFLIAQDRKNRRRTIERLSELQKTTNQDSAS